MNLGDIKEDIKVADDDDKQEDNFAKWLKNQETPLQEYDVSEMPEEIEEEQEQESITSKDVSEQKNLLKLAEPTSKIVVGLMDTVLPLLLTVSFSKFGRELDNKDLSLDKNEEEKLTAAWSNYLKDKDFEASPGAMLLITIVTIYGAKVFVAYNNSKEKEELKKQKAEIEMLKAEITKQNLEISTVKKTAEENEQLVEMYSSENSELKKKQENAKA
jgi:hypothetical protein